MDNETPIDRNKKVTEKYGKHFCAAPFVSLYEGEKGIITTCCKSGYEIGNTSRDSYENVVNGDHMKKIRLEFLKGDKPAQCKECWHFENETGRISSVRSFNNEIADASGHLDSVIDEMLPDGHIVNQKPVWLDLLSTNKCNFSCLGCKPHLSSTIAKQYNKEFEILHNAYDKDYHAWKDEWTNDNYPRTDYILKYGHTIKKIHLNGGEPFLSAQTYELLDKMIEAGLHETVELWSHTNGSILKNYKGKDLINDYFSKWKNCKITLSNDGVGKVGEYIRYGYSDKKWREVFNKARSYPHIQISIGSCINVFNAFHLKVWIEDLLNLCKENKIEDINFINLNYWSDKTLSLNMLAICDNTKTRAIAQIDELMLDHKSGIRILPPGWSQNLPSYKKVLENATVPATEQIKAFVFGVEALDKKRKVKFLEACPELQELFEKAKTLI